LQDGLGQQTDQPVATALRGRPEFDDVPVLSFGDHKVGSAISILPIGIDLPARGAKDVGYQAVESSLSMACGQRSPAGSHRLGLLRRGTDNMA